MTMTRKIAATAVATALALLPIETADAGIAEADNSNDNSNTNDVTDVGGPSSSGGGSSGGATNWPSTKFDWPPSGISAGGVSSESDTKGKSGSDKDTPIVTPYGQPKPATSNTKPIVPVTGR
jgi:hypothetical protein